MHCGLGVRTLKWGPQTEDGVPMPAVDRKGFYKQVCIKQRTSKHLEKLSTQLDEIEEGFGLLGKWV